MSNYYIDSAESAKNLPENVPGEDTKATEDRLEYIKSLKSNRDPKTGRFKKGHSGNYKGRPSQRTTWAACLNKTLAEKTTVNIGGKMQSMSNMQLACDVIFKGALARKDSKILMQLFKMWGSDIDLSNEFPPPKKKPVKKNPWYDESVEQIKKAIYTRLDAERDAELDKYPSAKDQYITNNDIEIPDDYIITDD